MLTLLLLLSFARADFFETDCGRYLLLENPEQFEELTSYDLTREIQIYKLRFELYGHPVDGLMIKFLENEAAKRQILP